MRKNQARNVVIHVAEDADRTALSGRISRFHVAVIERRAGRMRLTPKQRTVLLELIMQRIKENARHNKNGYSPAECDERKVIASRSGR